MINYLKNMLVHIKEIVLPTEKKKYALGAFNIHNIETALGVARGAVKAKSPAIIQVSESTIKYMGLKPITHLVSTIAKNVAAQVPIALHLDHGKTIATVFECIHAGFTSVHIDASYLPLDENIAVTKQVVELARPRGVWVQGEVGAITGDHGKIGTKIKTPIPIAKFDEVVRFVRETNVDTIAAAVGTAHGVYLNENIDFPLLIKIKKKVKKPFVLHGGSGVAEKQIRMAIKDGVNIINIGTDIKVAFSKSLIKNCAKNPNETDPRILVSPTIDAVEKVVIAKTKLFGSFNRIEIPSIET